MRYGAFRAVTTLFVLDVVTAAQWTQRRYDHNFAIDGEPGRMRQAAELICTASGRRLRLSTTEPGLQF